MQNGNSDRITPDLAAKIVKNYVLPMFESEGKRTLRQKYEKMMSKQSSRNQQRNMSAT